VGLYIYITISFLLLAFSFTRYVEFAKSVLRYISFPIPENTCAVLKQASNISDCLYELIDAHRENQLLKERLNEYVLKKEMMDAIFQENERLRRWMEFRDRSNFEFIPAQIARKNIPLWYSIITIDKGKKQGIKNNTVVLAFEETKLGLVGKVIKTYKESSDVLLISDPSSEVAVRVQRNGEEGMVSGTGLKYLRLIYLQTNADVRVGDKVVTSGYGGIFPPDIPIGQIKEIHGGTFRIQKTGVVTPEIDLKNLKGVLVVKKAPLRGDKNSDYMERNRGLAH